VLFLSREISTVKVNDSWRRFCHSNTTKSQSIALLINHPSLVAFPRHDSITPLLIMKSALSPSPLYDDLTLEAFLDQLGTKQLKSAPAKPTKKPPRDSIRFGDPIVFSDPALKSDVQKFFGVTSSNSNTAYHNNAAPPGVINQRRIASQNLVAPRYDPAADDLRTFRDQASTAQNNEYQGQGGSHIDLQRIRALDHCLHKS
jgi:hypothetical protein